MTLSEHWDAAYAGGDEGRSWTQAHPTRSLEAIEAVVPSTEAPIIDVGGGSSRLAGVLVDAGYSDVTVLDVSTAALDLAQSRLGERAARVRWIAGDLLSWEPKRKYGLWHDRAVLHFFTEETDRRRYAEILQAAIAPGGHAIIATFAPEGPERCSGLPVQRSSAGDVLGLLGESFTAVRTDTEDHRTPGGNVQPFTWVIARRSA